MDAERRPAPEAEPPVREIRLEGLTLGLAAVAVVLLMAGSFWLGTRFGPQRGAAPSGRSGPGPAPVEEVEVGGTAGYFDTAAGGEKSPEPARQAVPPATPPGRGPAPASAAAPGGPWYVQVFAGRDRGAAEQVVATLRGRGHPVRVFSQREGQGNLFKVRVGGYPTREAAQGVADRLGREGQSGAWVTRAD